MPTLELITQGSCVAGGEETHIVSVGCRHPFLVASWCTLLFPALCWQHCEAGRHMVALRSPVPTRPALLASQHPRFLCVKDSASFEEDQLHFRCIPLPFAWVAWVKSVTSGSSSWGGLGCAVLISTGRLPHGLPTPRLVHMGPFPQTLPKSGRAALHNLKRSNPHVG